MHHWVPERHVRLGLGVHRLPLHPLLLRRRQRRRQPKVAPLRLRLLLLILLSAIFGLLALLLLAFIDGTLGPNSIENYLEK